MTDITDTAKKLLIGMGNPILSDDAIGIRLATEFKERLGERPGLDIVEECCVGGLNLLDLVTGYERLIVVDSIKTINGVPGTWYRFDASSLRETMNLNNVHDTNFATALEFGRHLGMVVPTDTENHIFAVEIEDNINFSEQMTPALEAAYSDLVKEIFVEIERLLDS
jgi:hydrogenase maturation protease